MLLLKIFIFVDFKILEFWICSCQFFNFSYLEHSTVHRGGLGSRGTADNNYNDEDVDKDDDNGHDDDDMKNIAMMMMMVVAHLGLLQVAEQ